jgi:hypothetical protein
MEDKITIIEGPPPTFEAVGDGWAFGINESPNLADIAVTRLRTFNANALVERCYQAWSHKNTIHLEFRNSDGLEYQAPIIAARSLEVEEGQVLLLWVRLNKEEVEYEMGYDDDFDDDVDDDPGFLDF